MAIVGVPEINVSGKGLTIVDGDTTPSTLDDTNFGTVALNTIASRTFTVTNTGSDTLWLGTTPSLPAGFRLGSDRLVASLAAGAWDTFVVEFPSVTAGTYGGDVVIYNNDSNESPYNFKMMAIAGSPEINVSGKGVTIVDGDTTPSTADDTNFGTVPLNTIASRTYTVTNTGSDTLWLGTTPSLPAGFRLGADRLVASLAAGASDTFVVEFPSVTAGTYGGQVVIYNNDANESPYNFTIIAITGSPEIHVSGKGQSIVDGDITPSTEDDTDFGTVLINTWVFHTFTVKNTGSDTLWLGTPSVIGGVFRLAANSLGQSLAPNASGTFVVSFLASVANKYVGQISLFNSDSNESPYNFVVKARINHAPTNITLSPSQIAENHGNPSNIYVGDLTATDPDVGDTHTFTLDPTFGDGALFSVSAAVVYAKQPFEFEHSHGPTYSIKVTATDSSGLSVTRTLTITVTNVNEASTNITLSPSTIAENFGNPSHIPVGDLTAIDPDVGDTHSFTLDTTFGDGAKFSVGGRKVYAKRPFDFEHAHGPTYSIKVTATDAGGLTFTKTLTITVTDVNEAPVIDANQQFSVDENSAAGTTVGTVAYSDPDAGDTHSFTIGAGNTGNAFAISNTGLITVQTPAAINYEKVQAVTLEIAVTDSGSPALSDTKTLVITVNNVNEAPKIIDLDSNTAGAQTGIASFEFGPWSETAVTIVAAIDEDEVDQQDLIFTLSKTSGPPGFDPFTIDESSGEIRYVGLPVWLEDEGGIYTYQVTVTDPDGLQDNGSITIDVKSQRVEIHVSDAHAVEGTVDDTLEIVFVRSAATSLDASLTVSFSTTAFDFADFVADADA
ncbi:MAG: choice-of-anchor D domain-containing protein, partial [Planctomycetota bacterium]